MSERRQNIRWTVEQLQTWINRCAFNRWLGMQALSVSEQGIEIALPWRDDIVGNPDRQVMHGGVLATLVDSAGNYAIGAIIGRAIPTVDLRIDYHSAAKAGAYVAKGRVIKLGRTLSSAETHIYHQDGRLVASGRGVYFCGASGDRN
jgi:uncharacterized protein (TIGR00369 family)